MRCTDAIPAMLACELAELSPRGPGELSRHLADCPDCLARAEAIASGTEALRVAVASSQTARPTTRRRRDSRRAGMIGALLIAAGLLVFVTLRDESRSVVVATSPRASGIAAAPVPAVEQGIITIDDAQGRAVSIHRGQDTIDVVFHQPRNND